MSGAILRLNAALDGRYRIERQLGEGGMATVYLADDVKHGRKVALKVLKPELAAVVGAERFLAEIRTTANLQHPHILPLFDSGQADTFLFYVMPYVEGESLRQRLDGAHQLPVDEAVRIATDMAEALDHAHRHGVVHRDIKPANVLLLDGRPVIADFGIALAVSAGGAGRLTETGLSLGTPHYMSPEQATGDQTVGPATDIWALGCVLYEMLVGEPPYTGGTPQAILGRIITGEPVPVREHRKSVPPNVVSAIAKALEKLPVDRFPSAAAFAAALGDRGFLHGDLVEVVGVNAGASRWKQLGLAASAVAVVAVGVASWSLVGDRTPAIPIWSDLSLPVGVGWPATGGGTPFAISPDGSAVVFVGVSRDGIRRLWRRPLDQPTAVVLPGTDGALASPNFSPDGSQVAFRGGATIEVVSLTGAPPRTVLSEDVSPGSVSLHWGRDDWLYYINSRGGVSRVQAGGGAPEELTTVAEGEGGHAGPSLLPNGKGVVFLRSSADENLAALDLVTGEVTPLLRGLRAMYAPTGHLVVGSADGTISAVPFDLGRSEVSGRPTLLVAGNARPGFALSDNGTLVYLTGGAQGGAQLAWVDRAGQEQVVDGQPPRPYDALSVALSPDGGRVALSFPASGESQVDLWVLDLRSGTTTRVTTEPEADFRPVWSEDGSSLVYLFDVPNTVAVIREVRRVRADGEGGFQVVVPGDREIGEVQLIPGSGGLVFREGDTRLGEGNIGFIDANGILHEDIIPSSAVERSIALSPDGRWLAYASDANGTDEVYVRAFPVGSGPRTQVSRSGGTEPVWAHNGRELFFREPEGGSMMVATFTTTSGFDVQNVEALFDAGPYLGAGRTSRSYDVTNDDQRFLMIRGQPESADTPRLVLVQNFFGEIERRFGR